MKAHEILVKTVASNVIQLSLNRPEKRNALSCSLLEECLQKLDQIPQGTRVLIFSGEGPVFCSGLDLSEMGDAEKVERSSHLIGSLFSKIYQMPYITIAAVQGAAVAGGAGLLAAVDLAVTEKGAKIGFPETHRGLVPAYVTALLSRQICSRSMKELLLTGELVFSERAYEMGLVNDLAEPGEVLSRALELANSIVKGAPQATLLTKQLIEKLRPHSFEEAWKISAEYHIQGRASLEAQEGAAAFLEKRKPIWEGE